MLGGSVYVSITVSNPGGWPRMRFIRLTYHVACFLGEHPLVSLCEFKGYSRHGADAARQLLPLKTLWDHLEDTEP